MFDPGMNMATIAEIKPETGRFGEQPKGDGLGDVTMGCHGDVGSATGIPRAVPSHSPAWLRSGEGHDMGPFYSLKRCGVS